MSSKLSDYDYPLPEALIAKRPLPRRDASRMMVLHRDSQTIEHRQFRDLKTFLRPGDLLVLNNTRVLAARRFSDDHGVEFLFLEKLGPTRWKCLVKPGRKMRLSATPKIDNVPMHVEEILPGGERIVALAEDVDLRSEEHTSELQSQSNLVCRLLLEKKKKKKKKKFISKQNQNIINNSK